MSERVERMIKEYPSMVMERDCLRHQLANFQGITEEEVIPGITTPIPHSTPQKLYHQKLGSAEKWAMRLT